VICPHCGASTPADDAICARCGKPLAISGSANANAGGSEGEKRYLLPVHQPDARVQISDQLAEATGGFFAKLKLVFTELVLACLFISWVALKAGLIPLPPDSRSIIRLKAAMLAYILVPALLVATSRIRLRATVENILQVVMSLGLAALVLGEIGIIQYGSLWIVALPVVAIALAARVGLKIQSDLARRAQSRNALGG
jgi:hypothetical protein